MGLGSLTVPEAHLDPASLYYEFEQLRVSPGFDTPRLRSNP